MNAISCSYHDFNKLERHTVERKPLPGGTVYVLYPTDRPNLHLDIHQHLIGFLLSSNQLTHKVLSLSVFNFLRYRAIYHFWLHLAMMKNDMKFNKIPDPDPDPNSHCGNQG